MIYILLIRGIAAVYRLTLPIIFCENFLCIGEPSYKSTSIILIFGYLIFYGSHFMIYILLIRGIAAVYRLTLPIIFYEIFLCIWEPDYLSTSIIIIFGYLIFYGSHFMIYILLIRGIAAVYGLTLPIIFNENFLCIGEPDYLSTSIIPNIWLFNNLLVLILWYINTNYIHSLD